MARRVREELVGNPFARQRRVFLCGATTNDKASVRERLAKQLRGYLYEVHYPEHLFDELLTGPGNQDLLSLENLLADGVDAIVIVLEGVGAFTELGAFANHQRLREKLIVVQDRKYARDRSFIQLGPIRLLKAQGKHRIIAVDFLDVENIVKLLSRSISSIDNRSSTFNIENLFHTQDFILPLLYVLDTLTRAELAHALNHVAVLGPQRAEATVTAAVAMMRTERLLVSTDVGLTLTQRGQQRARSPVYGQQSRDRALDSLRVGILHRRYRRDKKSFPEG